MSDIVISEIKRDHIVKLLKDGKREDGRGHLVRHQLH